MMKSLAVPFLAMVMVVLVGCTTNPPKVQVAAPLDLPAQDPGDEATRIESSQARRTELTQSPTPRPDQAGSASVVLDSAATMPATDNTPVSINVTDLPVPVLVNEVYGNILGLNVSIDPKVAALQDLVTLNTRDAIPPRELFNLARQVLADYGVSVEVEGDLVSVRLAGNRGSAIPPLVVSGRALPDVPVSHRPIFQLLELEVVSAGDASSWLKTLLGDEVKVTEMPARNAILISGRPAHVRQAISALDVFDRPLMRGRISTRLEPAFLTAEELSARLTEVLNLQGYSANRSIGAPASVIVLPIASANSVIVFAASQRTLDYAISWARELDRPSANAGAQSMFYYQVKNTKAVDIAKVLTDSLRTTERAANAAEQAGASATAAATAQPQQARRSALGNSTIIVDEPRNALIYQGDPAQWERTLGLIRQMDRSPRQVMIEVTIAEVTLNDDTSFGISWFAKNGFGKFDGSVFLGDSAGGESPGASSSGLTYLLDVAGQNRAVLNAFASDDRVSILSTPRLLVKSGSVASIDVGTEVPTVTMSTTSAQTTDGTSNLLQSIQYRKTGILLSIEPTVYSDDRIDLDIRQEVSEALPISDNATANSPSIFNRALDTSLSLRDGGSVVMAGLISERSSDVDAGVPLLKDVPLVGNLFKNKTLRKNRTELVLIIVPYIVESDDSALALSRAVIDRFEMLDLDDAIVPPPVAQPQATPRQTTTP